MIDSAIFFKKLPLIPHEPHCKRKPTCLHVAPLASCDCLDFPLRKEIVAFAAEAGSSSGSTTSAAAPIVCQFLLFVSIFRRSKPTPLPCVNCYASLPLPLPTDMCVHCYPVLANVILCMSSLFALEIRQGVCVCGVDDADAAARFRQFCYWPKA